MLQLRWRWPILASLAVGLGYGSQFYTIGGLEHLHLRPKTTGSEPTSNEVARSDFDLSSQAAGAATGDGFTPAPRATEWRDRLNTGEKIALWQQVKDVSATAETAADTSTLTPAIVAPADFVNPDAALQQPAITQPTTNSLLAPQKFGGLATQAVENSSPSTSPLGRLSTTRRQLPPSEPAAVSFKSSSTSSPATSTQQQSTSPSTIRIASFQTDGIDEKKLSQPAIAQTYLEIFSRFDVIALQGITLENQAWLDSLVASLNRKQTGVRAPRYDYLLGPGVGRSLPKRRFAILFDATRVETDREAVYTLADPQDLVEYEPLVAWFRCRQAPPAQAFTFSMISAQLNEATAEQELNLLPQLIKAVERDGRQEDDWIMAGDFAGRVRPILDLDRSIRLALPVLPTDIGGTLATDSILFSAAATIEFAEQSGVYDFLRRHNLSAEQAAMVSNHLPVWAEFSIFEGGLRAFPSPSRSFIQRPTP